MSPTLEIHQVLAGAAPGDAVSGMARAIRDELRKVARSELYAVHIDEGEKRDVLPLSKFPLLPSPERIIVYHASIGEPVLTHFLMGRDERIVLVYHNMTPSGFFTNLDPWVATLLDWGRVELRQLRPKVSLAVADSPFNAVDLEAAGYDPIHVVPVGIDVNRLLRYRPDPKLDARISREQTLPYLLAIGQLFPHKRHELLVQAVRVLKDVHDREVGLVVAGVERQPLYREALVLLAEELGLREVTFTGRLSDRGLATYLRRASVYVNASEHEGFAVPPLEAMALGIPVVVRGCGALPTTVAGGGLVLDADSGPLELAEAAATVLGDSELRSAMQRAGTLRLRELDPSHLMAQFLDLLAQVV